MPLAKFRLPSRPVRLSPSSRKNFGKVSRQAGSEVRSVPSGAVAIEEKEQGCRAKATGRVERAVAEPAEERRKGGKREKEGYEACRETS